MLLIEDVLIAARTIYGEARGEAMAGKVAVAHVILNRVAKKTWYGKSIRDVCLKPGQFSCWNDGDPNREKLQAVTLDDGDLQRCLYAVLGAALGEAPDETGGSCHYAVAGLNPKWAQGKVPIARIGHHEFWNDIE